MIWLVPTHSSERIYVHYANTFHFQLETSIHTKHSIIASANVHMHARTHTHARAHTHAIPSEVS